MSQPNNPCEACTLNCADKGCTTWRKWWVLNWNKNIHRYIPGALGQVWQYEHPDRVREMAQEVSDAQ